MSAAMKALVRQPWNLWWMQGRRIAQIEVRRNLLTWKAAWVYFLAFAPVAIILIHFLFERHPQFAMSDDTDILASIVQFYYIRLGIFFGCLGIFSRLIRGEMIERSLHFYLLAPVRREVLLLAKFASGVFSSVLLFGSAIVLGFAFMYASYGGAGEEYVFNGPGMGQLESYLGVVVLGCIGYGAVFLLLSMMFKNPMPAAMLVLGWEAINPVMPSLLQKLSVASYLKHLMPITVPGDGIFALLTVQTDPVRGWAAVTGLLLLTAAVLTYSCMRMRKIEIRYTAE